MEEARRIDRDRMAASGAAPVAAARQIDRSLMSRLPASYWSEQGANFLPACLVNSRGSGSEGCR